MNSLGIELSIEESGDKVSPEKRTITATMVNIVMAIISEELIHARI